MTHRNWKIIGLRDGSMRVESDSHIMIFIQQGIANVYQMGDWKQEADVNAMSFQQLDEWIGEVRNRLKNRTA